MSFLTRSSRNVKSEENITTGNTDAGCWVQPRGRAARGKKSSPVYREKLSQAFQANSGFDRPSALGNMQSLHAKVSLDKSYLELPG